MPAMPDMRPLARTESLLSEEVDDELLIFDEQFQVACRLNASAALIWRNCDGERTVADLVGILSAELGEVASEEMVLIALDALAGHNLILSGYQVRDKDAVRLGRRHFMQRVGLLGAAVAAVPIVASMVAPTPASAASNYTYSYPGPP
jgi:hypothetical protein